MESGKQQIKEVRKKFNRKTWKQRQLLSESGFVLRIVPPPLSRDRRIKMKKSNRRLSFKYKKRSYRPRVGNLQHRKSHLNPVSTKKKKKNTESRNYFLPSKIGKRRIYRKKTRTLIRDLTILLKMSYKENNVSCFFTYTFTLCINNYSVLLMKSTKCYREN